MDAIYANNGDVNETAGDGLMVIFQNADLDDQRLRSRSRGGDDPRGIDPRQLPAAGLEQAPARQHGNQFGHGVGGRLEVQLRHRVSLDRYRPGLGHQRGRRVGAQARDGGILLTGKTADRVRDRVELTALGEIKLKNVSNPGGNF